MKKCWFIFILIIGVFILAGCSASPSAPGNDAGNFYGPPADYYPKPGDDYLEIRENQFVTTTQDIDSTFSLDTSNAGYANIRRRIESGATVPPDSVKLEEMVNYFQYDYEAPTGNDALAISSEIMDCPWNPEHKIVTVGVKAKEVEMTSSIRNNLVFLLDVSGSMADQDKLPLMQSAFTLFAETLGDDDIISIVTYSGEDSVRLEGASGFEKKRIVNVIEDLSAGGTTAGASGIETAYRLASKYFIQGGNNRVIMGTDGDFNVGLSSNSALKDLISEKRSTGVYLSLMGFGTGNLQDDMMETLAQNGNGRYSYIDSINEARKVLVEEIGGTLNIVAKDVKAKVVFNPNFVKQYRLLGYENKLLTDEEFENENTDAGEIGAGHVTTAVYEIVPEKEGGQLETALGNSWLQAIVRYKVPETEESKEIIKSVDETFERTEPSEDITFISCVIEVGLVLRNSPNKGAASYLNAKNRLANLDCVAADAYKQQFYDLVRMLLGE
jgi:Ca-activated chloride channel family protein